MENRQNITPAQTTHPGILIKDEIESNPNLNQRKLAEKMGVQPSFLNEIIKEKRPVTGDTALLLENVFDISAEYWMNFQSQYELDKARSKRNKSKKVELK